MNENFENNTVTYRQLAETLGSTEQLSEYLEKDDFKGIRQKSHWL